jgi:Na+-translocating ferredoxin:NAD+ oxidoreductase RnfG subunit
MIDFRIILYLMLITFIGGTIIRLVIDYREQKIKKAQNNEREKWKRIAEEAKLRESLNASDTKRDETKDEIS